MNPKAVFLLLVVAILVIAAMVGLSVWLIARQAGVRRRDYKRMHTERNLVLNAIHQIEIQTDAYSDFDSVLASAIRTIIRDVDQKRMELTA